MSTSQLHLPILELHLVPAVAEVGLDVNVQLLAVGLEQIVVQVQQTGTVLAPDLGRNRRDEQQRQIVRGSAVRDHLPVQHDAAVGAVLLGPEQQVVAPEVGVRNQSHRFDRLQQRLDQFLGPGADPVQRLQLVLVAGLRLEELGQLGHALLDQLLVALGGAGRLEEELDKAKFELIVKVNFLNIQELMFRHRL